MSTTALVTHQPAHLSPEEARELDLHIEHMVQESLKSRTELIKYSTECVALSTATQARSKALVNQGFCGRVWGGLTGKNNKLRATNQHDLATAQYAGQKSIVCLAEQNAMTMELAVTIGNRVNYVANELVDTRDEVKSVWDALGSLAVATKSKIVEHSSRLDNLERNQKLLFWKETIEDRMFNGIEYHELPGIQKLVCLASDFYLVTEGSWNGYQDLIFLRSVMREVGIDTKDTITLVEFYREFLVRPALYDKLIQDTLLNDRALESPFHSPIFSGLRKLKALNDAENYIVETMYRQLKKASIEPDKIDLQLDLLTDYMGLIININVHSKVKTFDFMVELLSGMNVLSTSSIEGALLESTIEEKISTIEKLSQVNQDNEHKLIMLTENINEKDKLLSSLQSDFEKRKTTKRTLVPAVGMQKEKSKMGEDFFVNIHPSHFLRKANQLCTNLKLIVKNGEHVKKGDEIAIEIPFPECPIIAPESGTIFWIVYSLDLRLSHCIGPKYKHFDDYMKKAAVKKDYGNSYGYTPTPCDFMAVISNEYDNTDDIIEWITSNAITLPSYFLKFGQNDFFPDFISDKKYRKQLTYDV